MTYNPASTTFNVSPLGTPESSPARPPRRSHTANGARGVPEFVGGGQEGNTRGVLIRRPGPGPHAQIQANFNAAQIAGNDQSNLDNPDMPTIPDGAQLTLGGKGFNIPPAPFAGNHAMPAAGHNAMGAMGAMAAMAAMLGGATPDALQHFTGAGNPQQQGSALAHYTGLPDARYVAPGAGAGPGPFIQNTADPRPDALGQQYTPQVSQNLALGITEQEPRGPLADYIPDETPPELAALIEQSLQDGTDGVAAELERAYRKVQKQAELKKYHASRRGRAERVPVITRVAKGTVGWWNRRCERAGQTHVDTAMERVKIAEDAQREIFVAGVRAEAHSLDLPRSANHEVRGDFDDIDPKVLMLTRAGRRLEERRIAEDDYGTARKLHELSEATKEEQFEVDAAMVSAQRKLLEASEARSKGQVEAAHELVAQLIQATRGDTLKNDQTEVDLDEQKSAAAVRQGDRKASSSAHRRKERFEETKVDAEEYKLGNELYRESIEREELLQKLEEVRHRGDRKETDHTPQNDFIDAKLNNMQMQIGGNMARSGYFFEAPWDDLKPHMKEMLKPYPQQQDAIVFSNAITQFSNALLSNKDDSNPWLHQQSEKAIKWIQEKLNVNVKVDAESIEVITRRFVTEKTPKFQGDANPQPRASNVLDALVMATHFTAVASLEGWDHQMLAESLKNYRPPKVPFLPQDIMQDMANRRASRMQQTPQMAPQAPQHMAQEQFQTLQPRSRSAMRPSLQRHDTASTAPLSERSLESSGRSLGTEFSDRSLGRGFVPTPETSEPRLLGRFKMNAQDRAAINAARVIHPKKAASWYKDYVKAGKQYPEALKNLDIPKDDFCAAFADAKTDESLSSESDAFILNYIPFKLQGVDADNAAYMTETLQDMTKAFSEDENRGDSANFAKGFTNFMLKTYDENPEMIADDDTLGEAFDFATYFANGSVNAKYIFSKSQEKQFTFAETFAEQMMNVPEGEVQDEEKVTAFSQHFTNALQKAKRKHPHNIEKQDNVISAYMDKYYYTSDSDTDEG